MDSRLFCWLSQSGAAKMVCWQEGRITCARQGKERDVGTYFMFGKYSMDAVGKISAKRTQSATAMIGDSGGEVKSVYALLGETDLVIIAKFPGTGEAMKASVALSKALGISFTTSPAVSVEDFDKIMEGI